LSVPGRQQWPGLRLEFSLPGSGLESLRPCRLLGVAAVAPPVSLVAAAVPAVVPVAGAELALASWAAVWLLPLDPRQVAAFLEQLPP
jgi:hypothetical protein